MIRKAPKSRQTTWKSFILIFIVLAIAGVLKIKQTFFSGPHVPTADVPSVSYEDVTNGDATSGPTDEPDDEPADDLTADEEGSDRIPSSFNLAVPFTSQAPFGVWDEMHEDTCEEASYYMVDMFYAGSKAEVLDATEVDRVLTDMVTKEEAEGYGPSIAAPDFVDFLKGYNSTSARIIENPTADDLKAIIAAGNPIIVPAAGRELGNPFFTGEGPLYHMLVIRGYTETTFITNDPGTRHGENYVYSIPTLMAAINDWNNGDPANGPVRVIVVDP